MSRTAEDRAREILKDVYSASLTISLVAMVVVCVLEVFMLVYTLVNPGLFGDAINAYRMFYLSLLSAAAVYLGLSLFVRRDVDRRYQALSIANPLYALFFFAWALGIMYFDFSKSGTIDLTVFTTFSLVVPLSFYLSPALYLLIIGVVDAVLLYAVMTAAGSLGMIINMTIFFIFQIVLGASFLRLKAKISEQIVTEHENAAIDVMTGVPNRRSYEQEIARLCEAPIDLRLVYLAIDVNGLKQANDKYGHDVGDELIVGAARCIENGLGDDVNAYRIGGDEFVVLLRADENELEGRLAKYRQCMDSWTGAGGLPMSVSYGYARAADHPGTPITELAKIADQQMYQAKMIFYQTSGHDRRHHAAPKHMAA